MTEALYYDDPRLLEFEARLLAVEQSAGAWAVELDRTAFYPEGGGQPADRGTLGGAAVTDVRKQGERIIHVLAARPEDDGGRVRGLVDRARRRDFMQQHTGQHLLSAVLLAVCRAPTVSVHLGDQVTTIELDVPAVADADLDAVEERAMELIAADLPVTARWVGDEELAGLALRRPAQRSGRIRIIEIGDVDRAACGGLHVARSAEIQLVRLAAIERIRGRLRTHWKVGGRAVADYRQRSAAVSRIAAELSSPPERVVESVVELKRRLKDAEFALEDAQRREARARASGLAAAAERSGAARIVTAELAGEGPDLLRRIARELSLHPDLAFCLVCESEGRLHWALGAGEQSGIDPAAILPRLLPLVQGKGGGKPPLWQGAGNRPEGREAFVAAFARACREAGGS